MRDPWNELITIAVIFYLYAGLFAVAGFVTHRHRNGRLLTVATLAGVPVAFIFWPGIILHEQC